MPRVMRRPHRRRSTWGKGHIDQLLSGHGFCFTENFGNESRGTLDDELMQAAWVELGDELLDAWTIENPCSRPYAWWRYSAPERRRRVGSMKLKPGGKRGNDDDYEFVEDGALHPFDNPEREAKVEKWREQYPEIAEREAYRLNFGEPNSLMTLDDFEAVYESECAFLERLGLITDAERRAMAEPNPSEGSTDQPSGL